MSVYGDHRRKEWNGKGATVLFFLFLSVISLIVTPIFLTKEVREKSILIRDTEYERCLCQLHDWIFLPRPNRDGEMETDNPVISASVYCQSGSYEINRAIARPNGNFQFNKDVNQTCYKPFDDTRALLSNVPEMYWSDAPHYGVLLFGFIVGVAGTIILPIMTCIIYS